MGPSIRNDLIMTKILVMIPITGYAIYEVTDDNIKRAIDAVYSGDGKFVGHECDEDDDKRTWKGRLCK